MHVDSIWHPAGVTGLGGEGRFITKWSLILRGLNAVLISTCTCNVGFCSFCSVHLAAREREMHVSL